mmetsp:Transcript_20401/g.28160  ORF Transcript_20401/g.28160 Transcript_20401/m.28160 type:complete len:351 (+) Transcript_20401:48-1100(+)|eukprot:CAMPEP_0201497338 /NCGR_PEP_ID=MMETSP0151_2-20130828/65048_1 /ASSEMBLY_ACC=CAM_ASM_000257 /TAXON_ID=200890 /ORGANISM="Paramoeba atlantica, Strain 621/1 / CCAP 1560/9" /LENGTH=350 /DNA_ID=CAMNT_0047887945 /DNA_START=58 /DNA_END=1113 /DNA_ORIENTATION=+
MLPCEANAKFVKIFLELANIHRARSDKFRTKAYITAAKQIKALDFPIRTDEEVKKIPRIGDRMREKTREILRTGTLAQWKAILSDPKWEAAQLFRSVHGFGFLQAYKLAFDYNCKSIKDVEKCRKIKFTKKQLVGLKYYLAGTQRIPYNETEFLSTYLKHLLRADVRSDLIVKCCGSFRRKCPTSGDIDVLLSLRDQETEINVEMFNRCVKSLRRRGFLIATLVEGKQECMGYCTLPKPSQIKKSLSPDLAKEMVSKLKAFPTPHIARRVDIRWVSHGSYPAALLHFTGSARFNEDTRLHAKRMGIKLNEYGIYKLDENGVPLPQPLNVQTERDIFKVLELDYVDPEKRD